MYQVTIYTWENDKRIDDMVLTKIYVKKGCAINKARRCFKSFPSSNGGTIVQQAIVTGVLIPVSENKAKETYCKCKSVYVDGKYGKERLRDSVSYGSHASIEELFYRSLHDYYGYNYNGNFYIEEE